MGTGFSDASSPHGVHGFTRGAVERETTRAPLARPHKDSIDVPSTGTLSVGATRPERRPDVAHVGQSDREGAPQIEANRRVHRPEEQEAQIEDEKGPNAVDPLAAHR